MARQQQQKKKRKKGRTTTTTTTAITYLQKLQLERTERFCFDPWKARNKQTAKRQIWKPDEPWEIWSLRCPETLFISHENANFLFSVFRVVQGEAKTPKIMGCCRANFAFLHALKMGTFRGKWALEWVIKTSHFVLLALYFFLITSKLAFSLIASQRCLARTAKNVWVRAQNSAKNNFLPLRLETYLAWTFLFLRSFLNNYPWISEKIRFSTSYEYNEWG